MSSEFPRAPPFTLIVVALGCVALSGLLAMHFGDRFWYRARDWLGWLW